MGTALGNDDLLQARGLEGTVFHNSGILRKLQTLQRSTSGKAILSKNLHGIRHHNGRQVFTVQKSISGQTDHPIGQCDGLQTAAAEQSVAGGGQSGRQLDGLQTLCVSEGMVIDHRHGIRDLDLLQGCATIESIDPEGRHAVRDADPLQPGIAEAAPGDLRQSLRKVDVLQRICTGKAPISQLRDSVMHHDLGELFAPHKAPLRQICQRFRNHDPGESGAFKCVRSKLRQAFGQNQFSNGRTAVKGRITDMGHTIGQRNIFEHATALKGRISDPCQCGWQLYCGCIIEIVECAISDRSDALLHHDGPHLGALCVPGGRPRLRIIRDGTGSGDGQGASIQGPGRICTAASRLRRKGRNRKHRGDQTHHDQQRQCFFHINSSFMFSDSLLYHPHG